MRRMVWISLALVGVGLLAAGWYAYDKGFTRKWRSIVTEELRKRGFEVSLRRMTLEPWRGIVAKDVQIYDARDRKRTLAVVDEVRLVINFADFFQGKPFLEALDLRDAQLTLPLDPKNPREAHVEINALSGRLLLPPHQLYLSRLDAVLYGIHVSVTGRLIRPEALKARPPGDEHGTPMALLARVIAELKTMEFEAQPPQLDVRFSGDLAEPEKIFVEATLWGEKVRQKEYRLENIYVAATFRNGVLALRQLIVSDARGVLRASGSYQPATNDASFRLESKLDAQGFAKAFGVTPLLDEFVFYGTPALELTVTTNSDTPPGFRVLGHFDLGKFAYKSVVFEKWTADFSWDGARWSARDVRLVHRAGEISGDVMQLPGELRSRLKNTIKPKILAPLLSGKVAEWFSRFEFIEAAPIESDKPQASTLLESHAVAERSAPSLRETPPRPRAAPRQEFVHGALRTSKPRRIP